MGRLISFRSTDSASTASAGSAFIAHADPESPLPSGRLKADRCGLRRAAFAVKGAFGACVPRRRQKARAEGVPDSDRNASSAAVVATEETDNPSNKDKVEVKPTQRETLGLSRVRLWSSRRASGLSSRHLSGLSVDWDFLDCVGGRQMSDRTVTDSSLRSATESETELLMRATMGTSAAVPSPDQAANLIDNKVREPTTCVETRSLAADEADQTMASHGKDQFESHLEHMFDDALSGCDSEEATDVSPAEQNAVLVTDVVGPLDQSLSPKHIGEVQIPAGEQVAPMEKSTDLNGGAAVAAEAEELASHCSQVAFDNRIDELVAENVVPADEVQAKDEPQKDRQQDEQAVSNDEEVLIKKEPASAPLEQISSDHEDELLEGRSSSLITATEDAVIDASNMEAMPSAGIVSRIVRDESDIDDAAGRGSSPAIGTYPSSQQEASTPPFKVPKDDDDDDDFPISPFISYRLDICESENESEAEFKPVSLLHLTKADKETTPPKSVPHTNNVRNGGDMAIEANNNNIPDVCHSVSASHRVSEYSEKQSDVETDFEAIQTVLTADQSEKAGNCKTVAPWVCEEKRVSLCLDSDTDIAVGEPKLCEANCATSFDQHADTVMHLVPVKECDDCTVTATEDLKENKHILKPVYLANTPTTTKSTLVLSEKHGKKKKPAGKKRRNRGEQMRALRSDQSRPMPPGLGLVLRGRNQI